MRPTLGAFPHHMFENLENLRDALVFPGAGRWAQDDRHQMISALPIITIRFQAAVDVHHILHHHIVDVGLDRIKHRLMRRFHLLAIQARAMRLYLYLFIHPLRIYLPSSLPLFVLYLPFVSTSSPSTSPSSLPPLPFRPHLSFVSLPSG